MPLGKVYSTEVKERRIVAYVTRLNAMGKPLGLSELFAKPPFVSDSIVIQFVDDKMQPQWRWPGTSEAWKLWDSIEFQVAAGHGFLEALLAT